MIPATHKQDTQGFPLDLADRCVRCGLCLPHCPTWQLSHEEAESPRGRIALMQGMALGSLPASPATTAHLEQCLGCRACEAVCPADVPYGALIDAGRAQLRARGRPMPRTERWLIRLTCNPRLLRLLHTLLRGWQASGLDALSRRLPLPGRLRRLRDLLPPLRRTPTFPPPGTEAPLGRVSLFTGCLSPWVEAQTLEASAATLTAAGYRVEIPERQGCCGALALHAGNTALARRQAAANLAAFGAHDSPVAVVASGCAATLCEYALIEPGARAQRFAARVRDVNGLLAGATTAGPRRSSATVLVHEPCTLRNVLGQSGRVEEMLRERLVCEIRPLPGNETCCGAAGAYLVREPAIADALLAPKLDAIEASGATVVVTANTGCALHLRGGLRQRGSGTRVCHPLELLNEDL